VVNELAAAMVAKAVVDSQHDDDREWALSADCAPGPMLRRSGHMRPAE